MSSGRLNLQPGKYTVHKVDGNEAIEERPLAAGDYYMQDGSILPGNEDGLSLIHICFERLDKIPVGQMGNGNTVGRQNVIFSL